MLEGPRKLTLCNRFPVDRWEVFVRTVLVAGICKGLGRSALHDAVHRTSGDLEEFGDLGGGVLASLI
ncbi:hypothetical protein GCM10009636_32290 [Arthrobacter koreensis]